MIGKQIVNFLYEDFSAVTEAILKIFDVLKSSRSLLEIIFMQYKPTFRPNAFCTPYFENVPPACRLSGILQHLRSEYIERTIWNEADATRLRIFEGFSRTHRHQTNKRAQVI